MKIKKLLIIIVLLLYNCVTILAHTHEIWIENKTGSTNLFIKFYPYGSLYNGGEIVYSNTIDYSLQKTSDGITFPTLRRANPLGTGEPILYIVGLDGLALDGRRGNYPGYFMLNYEGSFSDKSCLLGNDATITGQDEVDGIFGYGLYILEVYSLSNLENPIEQIKIDWRDFNYPHYPSGLQMQADLQINYYNVNSNSLDIRYVWGSGTGAGIEKNLYEDSTANGHLEVYNQYYGNRTPNLLIPNKNNAVSDTRSNFFKYPINATRIPNRYATYIHENPGDLGMNLEVNHDVTMIDTISQSTNILIPSNGYLKIGSGRTFNITTAVGGSINLIIQDSSSLLMEYSSHLIVGNHNMLTLKSRGSISFISPSDVPFAEIIIDSGATFCNEGGTINGVLITYKKSVNPHLFCATVQDVFYNDSTKIVLADSAVMEIPDGVTMHFSGIKSGLIMKPNSKLMLGVGCKIIFDSSASLIANGASFTSMDSTLKWDGIIL